jgi:photosystem II stability/assembly factor-like uncharacterized protein
MEFVIDHRGDPPDHPGQYQFCNICGDAIYYNLDRLVVVGGNMAQDPVDAIPLWITLDRGQSWQDQDLVLPTGNYSPGWCDPHNPVFFDDLNGIIPVEISDEGNNDKSMAFYGTRDGGLTWSFRSIVENVGYVDSYSRMDFLTTQDMFFACDQDLCVSHDGAQTWERVQPNLVFSNVGGQHYVQQFDFVDSNTGWALVGTDRYELTLWKTTDGGETWEMLSPEFIP